MYKRQMNKTVLKKWYCTKKLVQLYREFSTAKKPKTLENTWFFGKISDKHSYLLEEDTKNIENQK